SVFRVFWILVVFLVLRSVDYRELCSFPTRRSSDLRQRRCPRRRRTNRRLARGHGLGQHRGESSLGAAVQPRCKNFLRRVDDTSSDRKSTRLNSSHGSISYAVFCLKKKTVIILTLAR